MRRWVVVVALWPTLGAAAGLLPTFPAITDEAFIEGCVRAHNNLRATVRPAASNMRYLTWDAALARTARAWSNKCIFEHNIYLSKEHQCHPNFTSIGENIWVGSRQAFSVADAIKTWYNEGRFYTLATHNCTQVCGHYFQVVWDYSYKIGCAVALCKEVAGIRNAANFICNYSPSINVSRRPYIEGRSCSNCGKEDTCENKLCNYSRWHPPWESIIECNEACISLLVLRVLLMFVGFVTVYFLQNHFTYVPVSN
ncbi:GRPL2 protein, partial [Halcyon senegalensis]|nr:GRPL2 protein [Halcyon senegalensis]